MNTTLLIFTKYPHPGTVKTRLAATVGQILATEFLTRCAENTFRHALALGNEMDVLIYYSDVRDEELMNIWAVNNDLKFTLIPQFGIDVGERLKNALAHAFKTKETTSVLIIGTDTPDISSEIFRRARIALLSKDVVIGPAFDGGYYLIGMNYPHLALFDDIEWSSPIVALQTIQKAEELQLNVAMLDVLFDIDTVEDVQHWLRIETTPIDHPLYLLAHQLSTYE